MITEERKQQIRIEAFEKAASLDNDGLRAKAVSTHLRWQEAEGDEKEDLSVADQFYTQEMVRRRMTP